MKLRGVLVVVTALIGTGFGSIQSQTADEIIDRYVNAIGGQAAVDAIESLERYFVGIGAKISFNNSDHQGLDQVYFTQIKNGKLVLITKWEEAERPSRSSR